VYAKVVTEDFQPLRAEFEKTFKAMQEKPKDWID